MPKIPVLEIVGNTYRFVFSNFLAILGLTWVSALLLETSELTVNQFRTPDQSSGVGLAISMVGVLVFCLCYSIMAVAVTRFVTSDSHKKVVAHFVIGRAEWLMFRSVFALGISVSLILALTLLAGTVVISIAWVVAGFDVGPHIELIDAPLLSLFPSFLLVFIVGSILFVEVRYIFFLPLAAIMASDQLLSRSHDLSAGYFWPILAIVASSLLPILGTATVALGIETAVAWTSDTLGQTILRSLANFFATVCMVGLQTTAAVFVFRFLTKKSDDISDGRSEATFSPSS